jgi:hypothetical protein
MSDKQKACFCDYEEENGPLSCVLDGVGYVYDECAYAAELPDGAGKEECIFWCPIEANKLEEANKPPFGLVTVIECKSESCPIGISLHRHDVFSIDLARNLIKDLQKAIDYYEGL